MKKNRSLLLSLLMLCLQPITVQSQSTFKGFELDSLGYEWTAMCGINNSHTMVVSTVAEDTGMTPATGNFRLRTYNLTLAQPELSAQTLVFKGKMRVMDMVSFDDNVVISGAFHDSCFFGTDTLVGLEPQQLDAFMASIHIPTQQINWVWHRAVPQNNFINKLRYSNGDLLACGLADSSTGWVAQFNPATGQLLWEKSFPGARTLSDAIMDPYGGINITGTMSDNGHLNNIPVPLSGPLTGYRSYLARFVPSWDSVAFLRSMPYERFDFSPKLIDMGVPTHWSASTISNVPTESRRIISAMLNGGSDDTVSFTNSFFNIENHDFIPWHGASLYPAFLYSTPASGPGSYVLALNQITPIWDFMYINLSTQPQPTVLTDLRRRKLAFAFKSTGFAEFSFTNPPPGYSDALLQFPNASAIEPRWVMVEWWSEIPLNTTNKEQLSFKLYPQPVTSGRFQVQVENVNEGISNWSIRDLHGRILQTGAFENSAASIYCPQLASGMYIFELQSADRKSVQKLLVQD